MSGKVLIIAALLSVKLLTLCRLCQYIPEVLHGLGMKKRTEAGSLMNAFWGMA